MRILLLESVPDVASVGIASALRANGQWTPTPSKFEGRTVYAHVGRDDVHLATTEEHHIHAEQIDERLARDGLEADLIVFLSKHKSESGRPTLTAHPLGNYRDAALGGKPGRLTPVAAAPFTHMLRCLDRARRDADFPAEVSFEVTHHGPLLETPAFFVELGSADPQWRDPAGHKVLAAAVERFLATPWGEFPSVIGLGGGHYGPRFTEAALTKKVHFAHLVPTYHAQAIDDPGPIAAELRRACPGATGVYYHDGQLKKEVRERWFAALSKEGLPLVESRSWTPTI